MDEFLIPIDNQKDKEKQNNALNANNQNANSSFNTQNNALNASLNTQNNNLQNNTNNQNVNSNLNSQTSIDNTQNPQNNITAYDGYLLDKFGKGLNVKAKQDVDFKSRSINEPIKRLTVLNKALSASDEVLKYSDEAGLKQGMSKKLNDLTGGIWEMSDRRAKYDNALRNFNDISGQALSRGGNNSNKAQEEQRKNLGGNFTSADGVRSRLLQQRETLLRYMQDEIKGLESMGFKINNNTTLMQNYIKERKKQDYLKNTDDFNYDDYESAFSKYAKNKTQNTTNNAYNDDGLLRRNK